MVSLHEMIDLVDGMVGEMVVDHQGVMIDFLQEIVIQDLTVDLTIEDHLRDVQALQVIEVIVVDHHLEIMATMIVQEDKVSGIDVIVAVQDDFEVK